MSKVIECKGCIDCPFRYDDYNSESMGNDTLLICTLCEHLNLPNYFIDSYDSWVADEQGYKVETPDWCPLRAYKEVTIKLVE